MKTEIFRGADMSAPAEIIKNGGLVAVPTETVYGLAGNGMDPQAVHEIYEVKGRPEVKPLSLMVADASAMEEYCLEVPPQAHALAEKYWPGPVTIILKSRPEVPDIVRAGGATVGLRCPDSALTLELIRRAGVPLAAPSANPSGELSPKSAEKVMEYFDGKIHGVIDGGVCGLGVESTIISMADIPYRILRPGALPAEEIESCLVSVMRIIGITGGSGSGKTTALNVLKNRGALLLDCDKIYHELLLNSLPLLEELYGAFPAAFSAESSNSDNSALLRDADGKVLFLSRPLLADEVFGNSEKLKLLNKITHAHITAELMSRLRAHAMNGGTLAAIDAVELLASDLAPLCDTTVAVWADEETRIARICARDGISREAAVKRVKAQKSREYYAQRADWVLDNNGSPAELAGKFEACIFGGKANG